MLQKGDKLERNANALREWLQRLFDRASNLVVLALPGPAISTLAGMSSMRTPVFVSLVSLGLIIRLLFVLELAEWLREPIQYLLNLANEYWLPGTVVLVGGIAAHRLWRRWAA